MTTNTALYAKRELEILSASATDPENRPLIEPFIPEILALSEKFGLSGQSGGSAPFTATAISQAIKKLLLQRPICEITGIDKEWVDVSEYSGGQLLFQNNRCANIFKIGGGRSYFLDAIIWKDQSGATGSGTAYLQDGPIRHPILSRQFIKAFPFTPKTFYIDVIEKEVTKNDFERFVKYPRQLEKVWKYYDKYEQ